MTTIPYGRGLRWLLYALSGASVVEAIILEFALRGSPERWWAILLIAGGPLLMLGLAIALAVRPHTVEGGQLHLRFGPFVDLAVPVHRIASVHRDPKGSHRRLVELTGDTLAVSVMNATAVRVELTEPYPMDLGRRGVRPVRRVRFHADDPDAAVLALRTVLAVRDRTDPGTGW